MESWAEVAMEGDNMEIRAFKKSDRQAVIELWNACGLVRPWNDPDKDISRKLRVQPELFFVGVIDRQVMASAMAGYDGHRGSVYYLAVAPNFQHRGFGKRMMQHVEAALAALGCPKLNLMVRNSNAGVIDFYHRLGYSTDDVACIGKRLIPDSSP